MRYRDQIYNKAFELVKRYLSPDPSHGLDHAKRVLHLVEYIVKREKTEQKVDLGGLKLAAILHDLGSKYQIKKLKKSKDKLKSGNHLKYSLTITEDFLKRERFTKSQVEKIKEIIAAHGTHGRKSSLEGNILHDADLLDGIGLVGVLRKFTYGGQIGRDILGSLEFTKLKIKNRKFRTETGRIIGKKRVKMVNSFLRNLERELGGGSLL